MIPKDIEEYVLSLSNVIGVGIGRKNGVGDVCYVVNVTKKLPVEALNSKDVVPSELEGTPTDVVETGIIRAYDLPAHGGDSIGHTAVTAGTLGAVVRHNGDRVILSNNHVIANSNDAEIGDAILHPGPHDGGTVEENTVATLLDFVPVSMLDISECLAGRAVAGVANFFARILFRKTRLQAVTPQLEENLVDAAIALPVSDDMVADDITGIGVLSGSGSADIGMLLRKSGRTSGLTTGEVTQVGATLSVQYGLGKIAIFRDQVIASPMGEPGDSGSAMVDNSNRIVGLLFAGSDQATVFNQIGNVFEALNLEV